MNNIKNKVKVDTIYLSVKILDTDKTIEYLEDNDMFYDTICKSLEVNTDNLLGVSFGSTKVIDKKNYISEIENINKKFENVFWS